MKLPHPKHIQAQAARDQATDAAQAFRDAEEDSNAHPRSMPKKATAVAAKARMEAALAHACQAEQEATQVPEDVQEPWFPVLVALHGDTPFAAKLRRSVGAAAATGCPRCGLLASKKCPNLDGTPGNVALKSTAYGGVVRNAQASIRDDSDPEPRKMKTIDDFTYCDNDGHFDKVAAASILIDDDLDELLATQAEQIEAEEVLWYQNTLRARLHALGEDSTTDERAAGVHACVCVCVVFLSLCCCWIGLSWYDVMVYIHAHRS